MIYSYGVTISEAVAQLNIALAHTTKWVDNSNLVLNMDKCVYMILASPWSRKTVEASTEEVSLGDHKLDREEFVRYLGVQVDQSLQWDEQYASVKAKINVGTCLINRVKKGLPQQERLALYHAFVEPHLDFCAPVWSAAADKNVTSVEKAQRNSIRALTDYTTEKSTDELFTELKIEKVKQRWRRLDAQWLFRIRHKDKFPTVPQYMRDLVPFKESSRQARTTSKTSNIAIKCKTKRGERMFCYRLWQLDLHFQKEIWNCLSINCIRNAFLIVRRV